MLKNIARKLFLGTVPKPGERTDNCQDACAADDTLGYFAIADGVTKSFLPGEWSKLLVDSFINSSNTDQINMLFQERSWKKWLAPIQQEWQNQAKNIVASLNEPRHYLIRNQLATREPAASTFIGVRKKTNGDVATWEAILIGDSCLFHISKVNQEISSYLLKTASEFDSHPGSFISYSEEISKREPEFIELTVLNGDYLILATDAFSKWLLTLKESFPKKFGTIIKRVISLREQKDLLNLVEIARKDSDVQIESDDVGILVISILGMTQQVDKVNSEEINHPKPDKEALIEKFKEVVEKRAETESNEIIPKTTDVASNDEKVRENTHIFSTIQSSESISNGHMREAGRSNLNQKIAPELISASSGSKRKPKIWEVLVALLAGISVIGSLIYAGSELLQKKQEEPTTFEGFIIPQGGEIYSDATDMAPVIFKSYNDYPVLLYDINMRDKNEWFYIKFSAWIICAPEDIKDGVIITPKDTPTFTSFSDNSDSIGEIPKDSELTVAQQVQLRKQNWCNVQAFGYFKK